MFYFGEPSKQKSYQIVDLKKKCQTAECDAEGVLAMGSFHIYILKMQNSVVQKDAS